MSRATVKVREAKAALEDSDGFGPKAAKRAAFVREFVKDWNGTQAAVRAGYSENSAEVIASELLSFPKVKAAVARRMEAAAAAAEVDTQLVVSELYGLAMADPRDLMKIERDCCRYCNGIDYKYQWTPAEFKRELNKALADDKLPPDLEGGVNFDPRLPPVDDCPECAGRGVERVVITPSAKLSRGAARLLASMKQTRDGIEIKTRDQDAALMAMGRVVGIFKDRQEMSGPGGGPMQIQAAVAVAALTSLTNEELEAHLLTRGVRLPQPTLEATNEQ
jgi:phage terminase small subunit